MKLVIEFFVVSIFLCLKLKGAKKRHIKFESATLRLSRFVTFLGEKRTQEKQTLIK